MSCSGSDIYKMIFSSIRQSFVAFCSLRSKLPLLLLGFIIGCIVSIQTIIMLQVIRIPNSDNNPIETNLFMPSSTRFNNQRTDRLDMSYSTHRNHERQNEEKSIISKHHHRRDIEYTNTDFEYNQLIKRTSTTLPYPKVYTFDKNEVPVLIIILSSRDHFYQRQMIRTTWGREQKLYFVIGGSNSGNSNLNLNNSEIKIQTDLAKEQSTYGDIIDSIHPESYSSLPHKLKYTLYWIFKAYLTDETDNVLENNIPTTTKVTSERHRRKPEWIIKIDDDAYLRIKPLYQYLLQPLRHSFMPEQTDQVQQAHNHPKIVIGKLQIDTPVQRNGKWAESKDRYRHNTYPTFPLGSCGYAANSHIVHYIGRQYEQDLLYLQKRQALERNSTTSMDHQLDDVEEKKKYVHNLRLPIYQGEDISLGIWISNEADDETMKPKDNSDTTNQHGSTFYIDSPYFTNDYNACYDVHNSFSIGHDLTPEDIQACYNYEQQQKQQQDDTNRTNKQRQNHEMKHIWYIQSLSHRLIEDDTKLKNPKNNKKYHNNKRIQENWGSIARQQSKQAEIKQREKELERSKIREQIRRQQQEQQQRNSVATSNE